MFTQSQIYQFHHDGTIIAKNLIKGEELEKLQEAADKVVNKGIENAPEDIPDLDALIFGCASEKFLPMMVKFSPCKIRR